MKKRLHEKIFFDQPILYKLKGFIIEDLIWNFILCRIFRMSPNPLPDLSGIFADSSVLVASCGPDDSTMGPPIVGASKVAAFDYSLAFSTKCAIKRKDWNVYCGDVCNIPHRDNEFDISVIYVSLHHIPVDARKIIEEMARVTRNQIVVAECLLPARGLLRWMLRIWYRITDGGYHYYTLDEFQPTRPTSEIKPHIQPNQPPVDRCARLPSQWRYLWQVNIDIHSYTLQIKDLAAVASLYNSLKDLTATSFRKIDLGLK